MLLIDGVLIINSLLCLVSVASMKLLLDSENINGIASFSSFIAKHLMLQLIFISLLLITKGDLKILKISDSKAVYGFSIINGIFGNWIFSNISEKNKKVNIFMIILKSLIRMIPMLSKEEKDSIINDLDCRDEKKENN